MKKWLIVVVLLGSAGWLYQHPDVWRAMTGRVAAPLEQALGTGGVRVYRWQDPQGTVQLTSDPPPAGVDYELIVVDPDTNLLQAEGMSHPEINKNH